MSLNLVEVKNPYASSENAGEAGEKYIRAQLMAIVRKLIQEKGLKQTEAATLLGTSQSRISEIINGKVKNHTTDKLFHMLGILGWDFNFRYVDGTIETCAERRKAA